MEIIYNTKVKETFIEPSLFHNIKIKNNYKSNNLYDVLLKEKENKILVSLLQSCPLLYTRKTILIDIKIKHYLSGNYTCNNINWHLDGRRLTKLFDPSHDNIYHILSWGGPTTQFITFPFVSSFLNCPQHSLIVPLQLSLMPFYSLSPFLWHTYGELHWHKCPLILSPCSRVFIRIVESNYLKQIKLKN